MDPFSTVASAVGLIGDIKHLVDYLQALKVAIGTIDGDIDAIRTEVKALEQGHEQIRLEYERQRQLPSIDASQQDLHNKLAGFLKSSESHVSKFSRELQTVYGPNPKQQGLKDLKDKYTRLRRLKQGQPAFQAWRASISRYNELARTILQLIALNKQDNSDRNASKHYSAVEQGFADLKVVIRDQIASQPRALEAVKASAKPDVQNVFLDPPQALDSCYVGRQDELNILATSLLQTGEVKGQQRRFVVYGVGGSGKTQLCCKFALEYQQRFWGVFWIDGRSHDRLKQTLIEKVARKGRVARTPEAARAWLSDRQEQWLLIIDNADDPSIDLRHYFPTGGQGCILITTRNPSFRSLSNVKPGSLELEGLKTDEASDLLLKSACIESPEPAELAFIANIVHALGYLALAIAVAGTAICEGVCKLQEYPRYFDEQCERKLRIKGLHGCDASDEESKVEATFDISLRAIVDKGSRVSRDAMQMLRTFAFLHCENVHFDFLKRCVEKRLPSKAEPSSARQSWRRRAFDSWVSLSQMHLRAHVSTILPDVLREGRATGSLDEDRVRVAMRELTQYSLVTYNSKPDSWSMHPLVHRWARDSIGMGIGEQHIWCEAAATLISSCVLFESNDEESMRRLIPHVDEIQERQASLREREKRIRDKRSSRLYQWLTWRMSNSSLSPQRALMLAKFSIIYLENGIFEKAESLQNKVQVFMEATYGFESPRTRRLTMTLAETRRLLSRSDDAAKLLEVLLKETIRVCGLHHRDTYVTKLRLAASRAHQGRIPDAKRLGEEALAGLHALCGPQDEETLNAMDSLAGTIILTGTPEAVSRAQDLHWQAWKTREAILKEEDMKISDSRLCYYTTAFWKGDKIKHIEAAEGIEEIIKERKKRLGSQHPYTLLAMLYLARIKVDLRDFDAAQELFEEGLKIAKRDLGDNHVAVLFCRYHVGRMYVRQERWEEARDELIDVTERQKCTLNGWGKWHYDRIGGLLELARAHHELGEHDECDKVVAEAIEGFEKITREDHPWYTKLLDDWARWKSERQATATPQENQNALQLTQG